MYKKILTLCLSVAIAMSAAITPIYADNISPVSGKDGGNVLLSMLFKPDKNKNGNGGHQDVLKYFNDSDAIDWAQKSIEKLGALGIINGMENGLFKPNSNVTHIEAIAMVLRLKGEEAQAKAITTQPAYFKGQSAKWSWGYLQLALDEGIIIPSEDEWFNPNTPAKRHEIAKYIVRALGKRDDALENMNARLSFKDANAIPRSSIGYVYLINELGIMQGSRNEFQPNKPITRAEMAVLLDRAADSFDDSIISDNELEGVFVAYDKINSTITLNINNTQKVYKVNTYAPVYRNNTYYLMDTLKPGDVIEVVLDQNDIIIFIEFKEESTTPATDQPISFQHVDYSSLPTELKGRIDALKLTENYAAFRSGNYVYLFAARGQMPSGGYNVRIANVYSEAVQNGQYDLKAVVEEFNPTRSIVTQAVTYPYDIVRFAFFNGIDEINFYDNANNLLSQTTLGAVDAIEVTSGRINSVDATNRIIYLKESDNVVRAYFIPANVQITLDNRAVLLSALTVNMNLSITKTDGVITSLAAQTTNDVIELITGRINLIDPSSRIVYLKESDNVVRAYFIPANVEITLDGRAVALSALSANMNLTITKTSGIITRLTAQTTTDTVVLINGRINSVDSTHRIVYLKESDNIIRAYSIPANAEITLNNTAVALSALTANMNLTITKTNDIITRLAAQTNTDTVVLINGRINSVDSTHRIVYLKESDNIIRAYSIPANVEITLNNTAVALSALTANMNLTITKTNDIITKLDAQTVDTIETINGKINSLDASSRIVNVKEADNVVRSYFIPTNVQITLNNASVALSALTDGMSVTITRANGIITRLAATQTIQTINGRINAIDTANNTIRLLENNNVVNSYVVPTTAQITLNGQTASLSALTNGMAASITKVDDVITRVAAQNDIQTVEGVLINVFPSTNNSTINVNVGNIYRQYVITPETAVFYNNQSIAIQQMPLNITITIRIINGIVTEVRNK